MFGRYVADWSSFDEHLWAVAAAASTELSNAPEEALACFGARVETVLSRLDPAEITATWAEIEELGMSSIFGKLDPDWATGILRSASAAVRVLITSNQGNACSRIQLGLDGADGSLAAQSGSTKPMSFDREIRFVQFQTQLLWNVLRPLLPAEEALTATKESYLPIVERMTPLSQLHAALASAIVTHPHWSTAEALSSLLDLPADLAATVHQESANLRIRVEVLRASDGESLHWTGRWSVANGQLFSFEDRLARNGDIEPALIAVGFGYVATEFNDALARGKTFLEAPRRGTGGSIYPAP